MAECDKLAPTSQEVRRELEVLLESKEFATSKRQSALLKYLCEKYVEGEGEALNEYRLALEVFNRNPEYSPAEDSIVRVQAHELRRRLNEYYLGEGKDRPLRITIPKGSYRPEFIRVEHPPASTTPPESPLASTQVGEPTRSFLPHVLIAITFVSLGLNAWLLISSGKRRLGPSGGGVQPERYGLYRELFRTANEAPRRILICLSNPEVLLPEGWIHHPPSAYEAGQTLPLDSEMKRVLAARNPELYGAPLTLSLHPTDDEYTGMGEAACAFHLARLMESLNLQTALTQARFLNWDRAMQESLIVLGLPHTNWTSRNVSSSFFRATDEGLQLLNSRPDEPTNYPTVYDSNTGRVVTDYGVIAKETGPNGAWVLTLGGASSFGTYGVGEFFCDPDKMTSVVEKLRSLGGKRVVPPDFMVLVKINVSENIPIKTSYVTCRIGSGDD
jgi:hypothetical protein